MNGIHYLAASLAALGALASFAPVAAAAGPEVHVRPGFDHVAIPVPATTLDLDPAKLGIPRTDNMMGCHNDNLLTTKSPVVTFTVDEPTAALLSIQGEIKGLDVRGIAVMLPGNRILCIKDATRYQSQVWPAGTYALHVVAYGKLTYDGLLPVEIPEGGLRVELDDLTPKREPLDVATGPNPRHYVGLRHDERDKSLRELEVSCADASVTTERPALVFELAAPAKRLRVAIDDGTEAVIVTDSTGKSSCTKKVWLARDYRFVDIDDVPAGTVEIRTAGGIRGGSSMEQARRHVWYAEPFDRPTFAIAVEDLTRPRDLPWSADAAPPSLALTGAMSELWKGNVAAQGDRGLALLDVRSRRLPTAAHGNVRESGTCKGFTRSDVPAVILDAKRPMNDVWYRAVSNRALRLILAGPFGEDGRPGDDYREHCLAAGQEPAAAFGKLDLGIYRVYLAQPKDAEPDDSVLIVGTQETPRDPLTLYREPPATLAVADKAVLPYFAMLPVDTNWGLEWDRFTPFQRQDLVAKAPLSLFAYPKFDLDKASAAYWGVDQRALDAAGVPVTYPVTDEPLLVLDVDKDRAHVLTTDANMLSIDVKYLNAAPGGPSHVPTEVRNLIISWDDVVRWAAPEDAKEVAKVEKAREKADACYSDYWDKHHGGVSGRLTLVTYVNGHVTSVRDYTDMVDKAATAKCGLKKVDALQARMLEKLDKRLRKRGAEHLVEIARRFAE